MNMNDIILLILLTFMPFLELRASIPYGIFRTELSVLTVFLICIVANIVLVPFIWFFLNKLMYIFLKVEFIKKNYDKIIKSNQKKVEPYVEKYGKIGLALFIGIPLPGSGVYSGGLGAYLLGFDFKDYVRAAIIGVLISGIAVTLISVSGNGAWNLFIKVI
ncbi:hypothetical protein GF336_00890 [Candidatus Woesearchaeota archaeon]|nr:hypothetical protein [Candidatus Woesearchaeota archaeon]